MGLMLEIFETDKLTLFIFIKNDLHAKHITFPSLSPSPILEVK